MEVWRSYDNKLEETVDELINRGCTNISEASDDYLPAYAIMAALFEDAANEMTSGSSYEKKNRETKRQKNHVKCFIPVGW